VQLASDKWATKVCHDHHVINTIGPGLCNTALNIIHFSQERRNEHRPWH